MVNPPERRLSRRAVSDGCFVRKAVTDSSAWSYRARRLIDFRLMGGAITVWARCKISDRVWSPETTHLSVPLFAPRTSTSSCRVVMAAVCRTLSSEPMVVSVDQACTQSASHRLVTVLAVFYKQPSNYYANVQTVSRSLSSTQQRRYRFKSFADRHRSQPPRHIRSRVTARTSLYPAT